MLLASILMFVAITITEIVVPLTFTFSNAPIIVGMVLAIFFISFSVVSIINCIKRIKANNERGKSVAALVFSIINTTESAALFLVSIMLLVTKTAAI